MLLGRSGDQNEVAVDVGAVAGAGAGGVRAGEELVAFVDAVHEGAPAELAAARERLAEALGAGAMVDVAAVCANFHMMTRVADGTGTPLDAGTVDPSASVRAELALDALVSRRQVAAGD
ncbi:MAG: hypothetical protein R3190_03450 [Thermoanaerobaculia bacterium]|nr:hypothetical protein [Thermoanaerobaculia bacterium]